MWGGPPVVFDQSFVVDDFYESPRQGPVVMRGA